MITTPEIAELQMADAYEIVQRLHPEWLRARARANMRVGEPVIAVFLNGSRYGGVGSLRQISSEMIGAIEYLDYTQVQQLFTRVSGEAVVAAIMVSTLDRLPEPAAVAARPTDARAPRKDGWVLTGYVPPSAYSRTGVATSMEANLTAAGWDATGVAAGGRVYPRSSGGDMNWMGSVHRTLRPPFGMELLYGDFREGTTSGYKLNTRAIFHLSHSSQLLSALSFYERGFLRAGIGPGLLHTSWQWHDTPVSATYQFDDQAWTESSVGLVTNAAISLPMLKHLFAEVQAQGRFFSESTIQEHYDIPESRVDLTGWFFGFGLGLHF